MRAAALVAIASLGGCGASQQQPGPYYNDDQYLVLGVAPDAEAAALIAQLDDLGYKLLLRENGHDFTALGFADEQGDASRVRVVTARGIALQLDPEEADAVHEGVRYELLPQPLEDTFDADGDGFDEVFVQSLPASGEPPCILVYRVRDSGFVDFVPGKDFALARSPDSQEGPWLEPDLCENEPLAESSGGEQPAQEPAEKTAPAEATDAQQKPAATTKPDEQQKPASDSPKAP